MVWFLRVLGLMAALITLVTTMATAQVDRGLEFRTHPVSGWDNNWRLTSRYDNSPQVTANYLAYINNTNTPANCRYLDLNRLHLGTDFRTRMQTHNGASRDVLRR